MGEPLASDRTYGGVPVVIEHPEAYPFEPGERERDWHIATDDELAAYRTAHECEEVHDG